MPRPENAPPAFHLLAKPTGAACNLDCAYCFFLDKEALYPGSRFRMSDAMLEHYIRQLVESHRADTVNIAWQGGEPTLMGLDFYRRAMALAEKYRRPGMKFLHTLQTNGTLLDDEWAAFFKEHDFLIGISIDGPRDVHDVYRVDKGGRPTFDKVMRGLRLLQKHGVEYNVLTTVNGVNADYPLEVYRFLRDDVGTTWMQFIPVVERIDADGLTLLQEGTTVSERSVRPEQFGRFLCAIFDEWVRRDVGRIFVQTFEATLRNWLGMRHVRHVRLQRDLRRGAGPRAQRRPLLVRPLRRAEATSWATSGTAHDRDGGLAPAAEIRPGQAGQLPRYCLECDVRFACHGECPKNRFILTPDGEPGLNYLCAGFKEFFHHVGFPDEAHGRPDAARSRGQGSDAGPGSGLCRRPRPRSLSLRQRPRVRGLSRAAAGRARHEDTARTAGAIRCHTAGTARFTDELGKAMDWCCSWCFLQREPLHETQQHGKKSEGADADDGDGDRVKRGLLSLRPHARDRREILAPQVTKRPVELPKRNDHRHDAAEDQRKPQVPRGVRKAGGSGPGHLVNAVEELDDREAESDQRDGRAHVGHHRAFDGKPRAHPAKMAVGRRVNVEAMGLFAGGLVTHGSPFLSQARRRATSAQCAQPGHAAARRGQRQAGAR